MSMDYLMEGEILGVTANPLGFDLKPTFARYNVRVTLANGTVSILQNVQVATMFGGIGDSLNIVARTADAGPPLNFLDSLSPQLSASLGDRVIVAFLGGHFKRPVIVGYLQHSAQLPKFVDLENLDPQASLDYLGMTFNVDPSGQLSIIHRGAPEVSFDTSNPIFGDNGILPTENPALTPDDTSVVTKMEFLKEGGFRVRDSAGNTIWIDPDNQTITLSDVGMPSTDDEEPQAPLDMTLPSDASRIAEKTYLASEGESIVIDGNESSITIYSSDTYKKVIGGDVTNDITGDKTDKIDGTFKATVSGDYTLTVKGNSKSSVSGDSSVDISGKSDVSVDGDLSFVGSGAISFSATGDFSADAEGNMDLTCQQDMTLSAASGLATLKLAQGGRFEITGSQGGLVALLTQIIDAITQMTVPTGTGPSGIPINSAQFIQIKTLLEAMKA